MLNKRAYQKGGSHICAPKLAVSDHLHKTPFSY